MLVAGQVLGVKQQPNVVVSRVEVAYRFALN